MLEGKEVDDIGLVSNGLQGQNLALLIEFKDNSEAIYVVRLFGSLSEQLIGMVADTINDLLAANVLTGNQGKQLTNTLDRALARLDSGQTRLTCVNMRILDFQTNALNRRNQIDDTTRDDLLKASSDAQDEIGCS